jgi:fucose permease
VLPLCFTAFLCFGAVLVLLGANQDDIARDLALDLSRTGLLGAALAAGIGIGVVASGPLFDRYSRRPLFVGATLLAGVALLAVDASMSFGRALLLVAMIGIGTGGYDTFVNAAIAERFRERSSKPMSAIHSAATLGAMAGPFFVVWLAPRSGWDATFHWIGAAHLGLAAWGLSVRFPAPEIPAPSARSAGADSVLSLALVPFALVAFAYVGVEAAVTLFAVPYATEGLGLAPDRGRIAISAFWSGLLAGRLAFLALREPDGWRLLAGSGIAGAALLAGGVVFSTARIELLFAAVGLALGWVYPLMIALTGQRFPHARGAAAGLAAGAGACGGFALPWLTGVLGDLVGIDAAMLGVACGSLLIAAAAARPLRS